MKEKIVPSQPRDRVVVVTGGGQEQGTSLSHSPIVTDAAVGATALGPLQPAPDIESLRAENIRRGALQPKEPVARGGSSDEVPKTLEKRAERRRKAPAEADLPRTQSGFDGNGHSGGGPPVERSHFADDNEFNNPAIAAAARRVLIYAESQVYSRGSDDWNLREDASTALSALIGHKGITDNITEGEVEVPPSNDYRTVTNAMEKMRAGGEEEVTVDALDYVYRGYLEALQGEREVLEQPLGRSNFSMLGVAGMFAEGFFGTDLQRHRAHIDKGTLIQDGVGVFLGAAAVAKDVKDIRAQRRTTATLRKGEIEKTILEIARVNRVLARLEGVPEEEIAQEALPPDEDERGQDVSVKEIDHPVYKDIRDRVRAVYKSRGANFLDNVEGYEADPAYVTQDGSIYLAYDFDSFHTLLTPDGVYELLGQYGRRGDLDGSDSDKIKGDLIKALSKDYHIDEIDPQDDELLREYDPSGPVLKLTPKVPADEAAQAAETVDAKEIGLRQYSYAKEHFSRVGAQSLFIPVEKAGAITDEEQGSGPRQIRFINIMSPNYNFHAHISTVYNAQGQIGEPYPIYINWLDIAAKQMGSIGLYPDSLPVIIAVSDITKDDIKLWQESGGVAWIEDYKSKAPKGMAAKDEMWEVMDPDYIRLINDLATINHRNEEMTKNAKDFLMTHRGARSEQDE